LALITGKGKGNPKNVTGIKNVPLLTEVPAKKGHKSRLSY
jgi:hypothetical protein